MQRRRISIDRTRVYEITSQIPKGRIATYGDIAKASGNPKAARAVGRLMHINPNPIVVPCHRVVGFDGSLVGYGRGLEAKVEILASEGVKAVDGRIVDFEKKVFRDFR